MNKLLISLLAVSVAGNIYLVLNPQETEVETRQSEPEQLIKTELKTVTVADEGLKDNYDKVLKQLVDSEAKLLAVQNELDLLNQRIELTKLDEELKMPSIELDENGHPKQEVLDKFKGKEDSIKELYEKEAVDSQWAYAAQDQLNQVLNEHGDTSLYEIQELECKSSVCKVSLNPYSESSGSGMAAGMNAMMSISKSKEMRGYITSFHFNDTDKDEGQQVELFIAKPLKL